MSSSSQAVLAPTDNKNSLMVNDLAVNITIAKGYLRYHDSIDPVLSEFDMRIPARQWTCILGRSGCGKTSLLRYLAGLLDQQVTWSGECLVGANHQVLTDLNNQVAYMAQQDLLLPWLSVLDNVTLSSQFGAKPSKANKDKALSLLAKVGLADNANHFPQQLSGGMRQRVALARTLMQDKPVVLMDEPFSALDAVTRYRLQDLACALLKDKTVALITHDPQEAIRLADHIYIMQGTPASATQLQLPSSSTPRLYDAECAQLQQRIMRCLAQEFEQGMETENE
ncbi:ABC transporter ATP-binding protein [Moritella sp. F3]|uniref:ABC transporter ATP-binding protein n=1 Tax=Moritella sp. F3 TaxID=2718882 RepID=UPI0018E10CD7|nr:ABC transporter ATP-binding protein [Moritella sp. F3]GIC79444.1 ABC transporter ATP-binding protein [Moritella sp. F1]GIC81240.1 ABC transporter ATP-binding protein [Moritella sp. F3]